MCADSLSWSTDGVRRSLAHVHVVLYYRTIGGDWGCALTRKIILRPPGYATDVRSSYISSLTSVGRSEVFRAFD